MARREPLSDEEMAELARESLYLKAGNLHQMSSALDEIQKAVHDSAMESERTRSELLGSLRRIEGETPRLHHRITELDRQLEKHKQDVKENYVTADSFEPVKRVFYGVGIAVLGSILVQVYIYLVSA